MTPLSCVVCHDDGHPGGCILCATDSEYGFNWYPVDGWVAPTVSATVVDSEREHLHGLMDALNGFDNPGVAWDREKRARAREALVWAIREVRERIEAWEIDRTVAQGEEV